METSSAHAHAHAPKIDSWSRHRNTDGLILALLENGKRILRFLNPTRTFCPEAHMRTFDREPSGRKPVESIVLHLGACKAKDYSTDSGTYT
ncbi:hypothetical protein PILCRDRAFT_610411 [Piloderma croceum F 1598]|uniref:Uncharacterized protein n=1 Tax=Piloderma croceum (strain F 1598) TaxID=765440 RepID=A0A0C3FD91_PILCF|nr:hypothetical protein PILCRDRAFT_610411 [Piloderma croceum F 1598]